MNTQEDPPSYINFADEKTETSQAVQASSARAYIVVINKCKSVKSREENGDVIQVVGKTLKTRSDVIVLTPQDDAETLDRLVQDKLYKRFKLDEVKDKVYTWANTIRVGKHSVRIDPDGSNATDALNLLRQEEGQIVVYFAVKPERNSIKRYLCGIQ